VALPFALKKGKYLKAKEEELWKKSNIISPYKIIVFKKSSKKKPKPFKILL
jgi:hypothetical protein